MCCTLVNSEAGVADIYIQKHYPHLRDSATLINDMDLNLVHTNFFVDYPRLTAPNTKYVGGMHIKTGNKVNHNDNYKLVIHHVYLVRLSKFFAFQHCQLH